MAKRKRAIRLQLRCQLDKVDFGALGWYRDATKLIRELYGENWQLFIDILAATSPRQSVKRNWRQSAALLAAYLDRENNQDRWGDLLQDVMYSHLPNVIRALQRRPINGPKVSRFAENLKGNLDVVTVDIWMCRAYGIDDKDLTPTLYRRLEKRIQSDAKKANATPAGYQAVLWYAIRREHGLRAKSFVSVYRSIFMETPCFSFMQEVR